MNQLLNWIKIGGIVTTVVLLATCVDPLGFERRQEDTLLVVDGRLNLNDSVQMLSLTRTAVVGRSARFPPEAGATVTLLEDGKPVGSYIEQDPGVYEIFRFKPQIGKSYSIDIQLNSGERYRSQAEIMPPPVRLDTAYFTYNGDRTLTLFARTPIPAQGEPPYLRWRIRHVYQRTDQYCGGLDDVRVCYYELFRPTDNQLVPLLDGKALERGSTVEFPIVNARVIDSIFGEVTFYTIFQESMPGNVFRYWEKVNTLITQTGSIFDAPPGQIRGNVFNVENQEELVLGVFYPVFEEETYVKTVPQDFAPLRINPYCGFPGIPRVPLPFPECCFCPPGIPRPSYWR
jgi:hypothetical protein